MPSSNLITSDAYLQAHKDTIEERMERRKNAKERLLGQNYQTLSDYACGYLFFGLHKQENSWIFREWAPHATQIYLVGDFSHWQIQEKFALQNYGDHWEIELPLADLEHGQHYHLLVRWHGGEGRRIPAWAQRVVQDPGTLLFSAQIWQPEQTYEWKNKNFAGLEEPPLIYEAHVGMATEEEKVGSFVEFQHNVLPQIVAGGYNAIQLMAVQEHPYYGSFGYHVSNFFAPSFRFGTPEELKALIDAIHGHGLAVIMDIVHSHAVRNENEGLSLFDGSEYQYFHAGARGYHEAWDSRCFDYGKTEVLHFLLSNCKYWIEEFGFDGFRFDGVTSMLYTHHGLGCDFTNYEQYYDGTQDEDAIVYLGLANELIHEVKANALTIAEEMSGMPGIAAPSEIGGFGFDYRLAMGGPDYWIKVIKERKDEDWHMGDIYYELSRKRADEKTIHYVESHDQALVGDKTIIFRLVDSDMYWDMHVQHQNIKVDRGIALHKMLRLLTLSLAGGGYLNFMGNEFGHPEWIDFPREGNGWSYKYARRQWSLAKDPMLKYHYLLQFDRQLIQLFRQKKILQDTETHLYWEHNSDQVLFFMRGNHLFVCNFHPAESYTNYMVAVPAGEYKIVLSSDSMSIGGFGRIDDSISYFCQKHGYDKEEKISLYLPNRSAFVLEKV
ncbi:MAG: alpha amylase C-terminal domain-containing protein [Spirochaetota bacterium]